jgi:hypothetical protein
MYIFIEYSLNIILIRKIQYLAYINIIITNYSKILIMIVIHTMMKGYVLGSTIQDHKQLNFLKFKLMGLKLPLLLSLSKNSWLIYNCTTFFVKDYYDSLSVKYL